MKKENPEESQEQGVRKPKTFAELGIDENDEHFIRFQRGMGEMLISYAQNHPEEARAKLGDDDYNRLIPYMDKKPNKAPSPDVPASPVSESASPTVTSATNTPNKPANDSPPASRNLFAVDQRKVWWLRNSPNEPLIEMAERVFGKEEVEAALNGVPPPSIERRKPLPEIGSYHIGLETPEEVNIKIEFIWNVMLEAYCERRGITKDQGIRQALYLLLCVKSHEDTIEKANS